MHICGSPETCTFENLSSTQVLLSSIDYEWYRRMGFVMVWSVMVALARPRGGVWMCMNSVDIYVSVLDALHQYCECITRKICVNPRFTVNIYNDMIVISILYVARHFTSLCLAQDNEPNLWWTERDKFSDYCPKVTILCVQEKLWTVVHVKKWKGPWKNSQWQLEKLEIYLKFFQNFGKTVRILGPNFWTASMK